MADGKWEKRFLSDISVNVTVVPNLLIRFYRELGLGQSEFIFLLQVFSLTRNGCPVMEQISELLDLDPADVRKNIAMLMEKGFITAESRQEKGSARVTRYYFDGLYDKMMDLWACLLAGEMESSPAAGQEAAPQARADKDEGLAQVYAAFEREFGRALSPMEGEQISEWIGRAGLQPEVVLEALKRAVLRGILKFNYVDRILLDWQKASLRSLGEIQRYENEKMTRDKTVRKKPAAAKPAKVNTLYEI